MAVWQWASTSQHQDPETEAAKWNSATVIFYCLHLCFSYWDKRKKQLLLAVDKILLKVQNQKQSWCDNSVADRCLLSYLPYTEQKTFKVMHSAASSHALLSLLSGDAVA